MKESPIQTLVREKLGLRVGREMAAYIARKLELGSQESIAVMGGDARTGMPVRMEVPREVFSTRHSQG